MAKYQTDTAAPPEEREKFFPVLQWQWAITDLRDVTPALRFVAYAQSTFADPRTGECYPDLDKLAAITGYKHAWLKRKRAELVKLGYLELVKKGDGPGRASVYRLTFPPGELGYSRALNPATETGYSTAANPATSSSHQVKPEVKVATAKSSSSHQVTENDSDVDESSPPAVQGGAGSEKNENLEPFWVGGEVDTSLAENLDAVVTRTIDNDPELHDKWIQGLRERVS